ncbi:MAG TPA: NAD(P)-binding domain-containing protein [Gammaproteobacteria bacterium]|nr:NAD(P)-binding domain-containing protein [Gammaproteobacteria bacterium]
MKSIQTMNRQLHSIKGFFTQPKMMPSATTQAMRFCTIPPTESKMPVLEAVAKIGKELVNFEDTAFFSVQHILKTNVPLFKHLIEDFKAKPNNIYLSGKGYSDSTVAEHCLKKLGLRYFKLENSYTAAGQYQQHLRNHLKQVWHHFIDNLEKQNIKSLIIIDEGGHALETMPNFLCFEYAMAGIEQTRGGLYSPAVNSLPFPLIEVASSAIKRHLESPLIVEAILKKLQTALGARADIHVKTVFGVIGNGAIGASVTPYLLERGYTVLAYDENKDAFNGFLHKNLYRVQNVNALIDRADYILGCTGKDTLKGSSLLDNATHHQKFISCTSEDKEFYSLRKTMDTQSSIELNNRGDIVYHSKMGAKITLVNGGFPVNFDQSGESVPATDIQLTRALMLGACIQAGLAASKPEGGTEIALTQRIQLDAKLQRFVAQQLRQYQPINRYSLMQWQLSQDLNWIKNNSGGQVCDNQVLARAFSAGFKNPKKSIT